MRFDAFPLGSIRIHLAAHGRDAWIDGEPDRHRKGKPSREMPRAFCEPAWLRLASMVMLAVVAMAACAAPTQHWSSELAREFACNVDRQIEPPAEEQAAYARRLRAALSDIGLADLQPQHFLLVDRSPRVQAGFIYWLTPGGEMLLVGAFPVATGEPGTFEHFATPLGVFEHSLANPDFRAEGTRNEYGIMGYGRVGTRVFDFGWIPAPKGWGNRAESEMRLQVHATDPQLLEPLLGRARSKGCIRIPAAVDEFMDRYGILDADYEAATHGGRPSWVLRTDRETTRWPGRYLVVIDSERANRPAWSPGPGLAMKQSPRPAQCAR